MDAAKQQSLVEAGALLRQARTGTLSVLDHETGGPFGALINVAVDRTTRPLILISKLSRHTKALLNDPRASVMVHAPLPMEADPLTQMRVTVTGEFEVTAEASARDIYLAHHPYADMYAGFGDFSFWQMIPKKLYVVAGFGRVYAFEFSELN